MGGMPYAYSYSGAVLDWDSMMAKATVNRVDPEMLRRFKAMADAQFKAIGVPLGVGTGFRSATTQRQLFLSRYVIAETGISWEGKFWRKKPNVASAAPPGRSYHEETTPEGKALAIDAVGWENGWAGKNASRFGLHMFADVNDEPWHFQPIEVPNSRSKYQPHLHALKKFVLPGESVAPTPPVVVTPPANSPAAPPTPTPETPAPTPVPTLEDIMTNCVYRDNGEGRKDIWLYNQFQRRLIEFPGSDSDAVEVRNLWLIADLIELRKQGVQFDGEDQGVPKPFELGAWQHKRFDSTPVV